MATVRHMTTFQISVRPGGGRMIAVVRDAMAAEGVRLVAWPQEDQHRSAPDMAALAMSTAAFVVQAADSAAVARAVERVRTAFRGKPGPDPEIEVEETD